MDRWWPSFAHGTCGRARCVVGRACVRARPSLTGDRLQSDPSQVRRGDGGVAGRPCPWRRVRAGLPGSPPTLPAMSRGLATLVLGVVSAGAFLSGLELMITAVALPAIVNGLADWTELRVASWIINGYLLVSIVVMPLAGQLVDRHGERPVFLWALVIFVAGSILAGRATGLVDLIGARLVQAAGGGSLVPVATAAASHLFDGPARPRALGAVGALTFLGMAAGPFAGAWIMQAVHPAPALEAAGVQGPLFDA